VLARAEADSLSGRRRATVERPKQGFAWGGWLAAAAALVLAAVFLYSNAGLRTEVEALNARVAELESQVNTQNTRLASLTSPSTETFKLAGQGATPQAKAKIFWNQSARRWEVFVEDLPALGNEQVYQLWFVPPTGNPISAEVFNTNANGRAEFEINVPPEVTALMAAAVTVEPGPRGSPLPTTTNGFALLGTP
jgi:anti-sigma-K factor RskA